MAWMGAIAGASAAAYDDEYDENYGIHRSNANIRLMLGILIAMALGFLLFGFKLSGIGFGGGSSLIFMMIIMVFIMMIAVTARRTRIYNRIPQSYDVSVSPDRNISNPRYSQPPLAYREEVKQDSTRIYCPHCGTFIENRNSRFCPICGQLFD